MGQSISTAVETLQNDAQKEKLANDAMNSLIELAKMQVQAFELAVRNQSDNQIIPVDKILEKDNIIQCNISNEPADIQDMIEDTFSSFINGNLLSGVSKLVGNGLKLLLGSYSGNSSSRDLYAITCGDLGGISRVDMHFYSYRYTSSQLTEIAKQVLCVSIVRSSVDPTKLSDATLRNIVQNTYGASSLEEQERIYGQLRTARDVDLQSRSGGAVVPSLAVAAARASHFTRKSSRAPAAAKGSTSAEEAVYMVYTKTYTSTLQINTASDNIESLKNWIYGFLYAEFQVNTIDNGIVVTAQVDPTSVSNSTIMGHIVLTLSSELQDPEKAFYDQLHEALHGAVSNKCPIPALSFTIDGFIPADEAGDDGGLGAGDPWPQYNEYGEEVWPEDELSDIDDLLDSLDEEAETSGRVLSSLDTGDVSLQNVYQGRFYADANRKAADKDIRRLNYSVATSDEKKNLFIWPLLERLGGVPEGVRKFFGRDGSHVHVRFTDASSPQAGWEFRGVMVTLRHTSDSNKRVPLVDKTNHFTKDGNFHKVPKAELAGTVDEDKLAGVMNWWCEEGEKKEWMFGKNWDKLRDEKDAKGFGDLLKVLKQLEQDVDNYLNQLTNGDWLTQPKGIKKLRLPKSGGKK